MNINHTSKFNSDEEKLIKEGFDAYNLEQGQSSDRTPLALTIYNEDGVLLGALDGYIFFDYITISRLWVYPTVRDNTIGTKLIKKAHSIAQEAGCIGSTLSTYDFQAREFYEKCGYKVFGILPNNPRGHERFFMLKLL